MKAIKNYSVIYQDESIVVLNKVSGLLVASDRYDKEAPRLDKLAEQEFGRLLAVHRIDKDTSGIVIYARTADAHRFLSIAFERREVHKTYHALVHGRPAWEEYTHKAKLLPDGDPRHRTVVNKRMGKESVTNFKLLGTVGPYSWIQADPVTGRTHQIRAHLQFHNYPIVGDFDHNSKENPFNRLCLHAKTLEFIHPVTKEKMRFEVPAPKEWFNFCSRGAEN